MNMFRRFAGIHALAMAAVAFVNPAATAKGVHRVEGGTRTARRITAANNGYIPRPLRTVAQDKRDAKKARNRQRNKRAHRGARA